MLCVYIYHNVVNMIIKYNKDESDDVDDLKKMTRGIEDKCIFLKETGGKNESYNVRDYLCPCGVLSLWTNPKKVNLESDKCGIEWEK